MWKIQKRKTYLKKEIAKEMAEYLKEQTQHFGCEVKYWGTGKNRFQLEVPVAKVNHETNIFA